MAYCRFVALSLLLLQMLLCFNHSLKLVSDFISRLGYEYSGRFPAIVVDWLQFDCDESDESVDAAGR